MLKLVSKWLRGVANYISPIPEQEQKFTLTATIVGDDEVQYKLSRDMSPELFAKLVVRMAIMTDGTKFVKILSDNGYVDSFYRLQSTSNMALAAIFEAATTPDNVMVVEQSTQPQEQVEQAPKPQVVERPVIEALVG